MASPKDLFSADAEEYVISGLLLDAPEALKKMEEAGGSSSSFYVRAHATIWECGRTLFEKRQPIDAATVAESLKSAGLLDAVGGIPFITQASARLTTTVQLGFFIDRVVSLERLRAIRRTADRLAELTTHGGDPAEVAAAAERELTVAAGSLTRGAREWPSCVSMADLCAKPPATPPELIRGLLYQGGTMMLSGASKTHKTYTMLAAGLAIASGEDWLGMSTQPAPVLYLNLELQDFATEHRLASIARAMRMNPSKDFHLLNLRGRVVTVDALESRIPELLEQTAAKLVIVDPHYKISSASGVEENSNDGQAALLYRLEAAICSRGAAVMLAHHFAKGDSSSKKAIDRAAGGGALARWPDVVMTMTEHEEENCVTAEFALRNFAPVSPFVLRWEHPVWIREEGMNPAQLKKAGRSNEHPASELLGYLKDGMSNAEWRNASGWSDGTFRRKREELISARKVTCFSGTFSHVPPQSPQSPKSILAA